MNYSNTCEHAHWSWCQQCGEYCSEECAHKHGTTCTSPSQYEFLKDKFEREILNEEFKRLYLGDFASTINAPVARGNITGITS